MNCEHKLALGLEYLGANYKGWQNNQNDLPSIQGSLEQALSRVANEKVETLCAGRTDAGVNAFEQVVSFTTTANRTDYAWQAGTNANLPEDIKVLWVKQVDDSFNARFSAIARRYYYFVSTSKNKSVFLNDKIYYVQTALDFVAMQEALVYLQGKHDFSSFRASGCQASNPNREIFIARVERSGELFKFEFVANAFLQHMVRNIVGSILQVGLGKYDPSWIEKVLIGKDRKLAGPCAPPQGLYFSQVHYASKYNIPHVHSDFSDLLLNNFD